MRSSHRIAFVFVLSVLLVGCAATVKKTGEAAPIKVGASATKSIVLSITGDKDATDSKDWEPFKGLWREAMKEEADGIGASFTAEDGAPSTTAINRLPSRVAEATRLNPEAQMNPVFMPSAPG